MENGTIEIHFDLGKAGHELAGPYSRWAESLLLKKKDLGGLPRVLYRNKRNE
jgi:hypothetical protein